MQRLNVLESSDDEKRVQEILARLKVEVSCRRLLLYPYFRDFDRVSYYVMLVYILLNHATTDSYNRYIHIIMIAVNIL